MQPDLLTLLLYVVCILIYVLLLPIYTDYKKIMCLIQIVFIIYVTLYIYIIFLLSTKKGSFFFKGTTLFMSTPRIFLACNITIKY